MRVLLLGGTGSIGSAILEDLIANGHSVTALARSEKAATILAENGAIPLSGDLTKPKEWAPAVSAFDAVIQAAASFDTDMGAIDKEVLEAIAENTAGRKDPLRVIYTGGCWLYGETGARIADEMTPFDPLPSFVWMVQNWQWLCKADGIAPILIHPAMVYDQHGGVLSRYIEAAWNGQPIEIWGTPDAIWPLVHRTDLASAYRLAMESASAGQSYCVAAETGISTGSLADAIATRSNSSIPHKILPLDEAIARHGDWAAGPALKQHMSGAKIRHELGWKPRFEDAVSMLRGETV
tara:strand:+ start:413 stop:1294 length:882 start_codon:yes stop_codon:yes gene_type:complete